MIEATGSCAGIENYSRYLTGRKPGEPPPTLFEYLPDNALVFVDESHVTVPQIGGMYRGDFRRKSTLAEYGFRLPSCMDNRPLSFEEWDAMRPQTGLRLGHARRLGDGAHRRRLRRAGDPPHRPDRSAGRDPPGAQPRSTTSSARCARSRQRGYRALVTMLTKRMAEDLTEYMHEQGMRVRYMHSDVETLERIEIIRDLRLGAFDVLVGINLLREGLDIPECALVAILDADKEGFLRSETSLIQTIGRAARNVDGKVILYADHDHRLDGARHGRDQAPAREADAPTTPSTASRRRAIKRNIGDILDCVYERDHVLVGPAPASPSLRPAVAAAPYWCCASTRRARSTSNTRANRSSSASTPISATARWPSSASCRHRSRRLRRRRPRPGASPSRPARPQSLPISPMSGCGVRSSASSRA